MDQGGGLMERRRRVKPAQLGEVVDLGSKFGISFHGSDSESSDEEFEPANTELDSDDSHEILEEVADKEEEAVAMETDEPRPPNGTEYNPLIVRRSNRAIKPTKDIDLYLLGAQYGIDLEGSEVDSSDPEFSPNRRDKTGSVSGSSLSESIAESADNDNEKRVSEKVSECPLTATLLAAIPLCAVCLEDSQDDGDIVECDWCGISVHEGCYGVPEEDGVDQNRSSLSSFTTIPWFCDACKAGVSPTSCHCELCPTIGGLFKQSVNGRWIHVVCGLYTPGIEYAEPNLLSGVTLDRLIASRWGAKECQLCLEMAQSKTGVVINCDAGMCKACFHVTCAQRFGLLCEVEDSEDKELCDPYFAHCKAHADKDIAKRKKRDYLSVINKQKSFVRSSDDNRIQHYLDQARADYLTTFRKMQKEYQPDLMFRNEERLLQYLPSAFHYLTQKAQLLGYETEGISHVTETKRMVPPGLTADFVNYYHERQSRVSSTEAALKLLSETNTQLKTEEKDIKQYLSVAERQLGPLRAQGQQFQSQANSLYLNMSRLTNVDMSLPAQLRDSVLEDTQEESPRTMCVVCEGVEDSHLMVLCDTCDNHYHISCVDPPLTKVPKKTSRYGWECHRCYRDSEDELAPTLAAHNEPSSRSGRKIQPPKTLEYLDSQVNKTAKKARGKNKK